jgi:outer membrane lipoprotein-sorting protein
MNWHRHYRFFVVVLLTSLSAPIAVAAPATVWDVPTLMQMLTERKTARATFVETTYLAILERPITASGELAFSAPDHLEKLTLKPKHELLVLDGDTLTVERNHRNHRLELADYPQIAVFIDSIRGVLAGDLAALTRSYELALSGDAEHWSLRLLPKAPFGGIDKIIISGAANALESIEIQQQDGDRSIMRIDDIAAKKMPSGSSQ